MQAKYASGKQHADSVSAVLYQLLPNAHSQSYSEPVRGQKDERWHLILTPPWDGPGKGGPLE
jgi:hypothetical protein